MQNHRRSNDMISSIVWIACLAYIQNITFSIVSRARNRDNMRYHLIAAIGSNTIWFLTFRILVLAEMPWFLFIPYVFGTVAGSLTGAQVSLWIERTLGAVADAQTPDKIKVLEQRIIVLENNHQHRSNAL